MAAKKQASNYSVFGVRPENAICLPDIPYSVRLNCKDGGIFIGGCEPKNRKTDPEKKVEVSIVKASKFFGSLGKTQNVLWIQLFFVPAPSVAAEILPKNTVCVSYIKKQSVSHLFNKVQEAMNYGDPGFGIFTLGFNREVGEKGTYYTVSFDWRERKSDEEKKQLELIKGFMQNHGNQLVDMEASRDMTCVDGWPASDIQALIAQKQQQEMIEAQTKTLPAA